MGNNHFPCDLSPVILLLKHDLDKILSQHKVPSLPLSKVTV